jgi:hypothetical protein
MRLRAAAGSIWAAEASIELPDHWESRCYV